MTQTVTKQTYRKRKVRPGTVLVKFKTCLGLHASHSLIKTLALLISSIFPTSPKTYPLSNFTINTTSSNSSSLQRLAMALGFATRSKSLPSGHRPGRKEAATNSSPRPSTAASTLLEQDVDVEVQKILFSMDYGTKTLSLAYRLAKPGESPSATNVFDIHFSEREYFAPQAAAWAEDGTFYWGYVSHSKITLTFNECSR